MAAGPWDNRPRSFEVRRKRALSPRINCSPVARRLRLESECHHKRRETGCGMRSGIVSQYNGMKVFRPCRRTLTAPQALLESAMETLYSAVALGMVWACEGAQDAERVAHLLEELRGKLRAIVGVQTNRRMEGADPRAIERRRDTFGADGSKRHGPHKLGEGVLDSEKETVVVVHWQWPHYIDEHKLVGSGSWKISHRTLNGSSTLASGTLDAGSDKRLHSSWEAIPPILVLETPFHLCDPEVTLMEDLHHLVL